MAPDETLLIAWQRGDSDAGVTLFERHYDALVRFFCNKVDDADRDDVVQQTFLAAQQAAFNGRSTVRTWLFAIAWRRLIDHFRRRATIHKREVGGVEHLSAADLGANPEAVFARGQERRLLLEGLRRLPLHHQVVLELHYWEDLTGAAIAELLDIPLGTAKTRLRDGRRRLAQILEAIATSEAVLRSTLDDLDGWARRAHIHAHA